MTFPAIHTLPAAGPHDRAGRPHGHDFTVVFTFEAAALVHPGVVVDEDMRSEIDSYIDRRMAYHDLNRILPAGTAPTCEAIANHLAGWHRRSARLPGHALLTQVSVTTGSGGHGEVHLPHPLDERPARRSSRPHRLGRP